MKRRPLDSFCVQDCIKGPCLQEEHEILVHGIHGNTGRYVFMKGRLCCRRFEIGVRRWRSLIGLSSA